MSGFIVAPVGVATLARISNFRWPFLLYLPGVLLGGLFASEYFVGPPIYSP
jgi:hypothetical protein